MKRMALRICPRDLLFFRDARPMSGSSEGAGAHWPLPSVFHAALLRVFHDRWPERQDWEIPHVHLTEKEKKRIRAGRTSSMRFGGLRTWGPFPVREKELFFPTPADLGPNGAILAPVRPWPGSATNLPPPLKYPVASPVRPTKDQAAPWISWTNLQRYLAGDTDTRNHDLTTPASALFLGEPRPGVGIDPDTRANREKIFYQAEYLRLAEGVDLLGWAAAPESVAKGGRKDLLEKLADGATSRISLLLGGQGGLAEATSDTALENVFAFPGPGRIRPSRRIKWVLLSPACFSNGWIPDFVNPTADGTWLPADKPDRGAEEKRAAWRQKVAQCDKIRSRLVAARLPPAQPYSGWRNPREEPETSLQERGGRRALNGPRNTRLLVPAGAVYYFECEDDRAAEQLVGRLHLQTASGSWGEQGFGFGICGEWEFQANESQTAKGDQS